MVRKVILAKPFSDIEAQSASLPKGSAPSIVEQGFAFSSPAEPYAEPSKQWASGAPWFSWAL